MIGGGPAGSIAALCRPEKMGRRRSCWKKRIFRRFHIGESFLPATFDRLKELGILPALRKLPHVPKFGAQFAMGNGGTVLQIDLSTDLVRTMRRSTSSDRFSTRCCLTRPSAAGPKWPGPGGRSSNRELERRRRATSTDAGEIRGRICLTPAGKERWSAGTWEREAAEESQLRKVAYFNHFDNVWRPEGKKAGHPLIAMVEEGWFWMIPLNENAPVWGWCWMPTSRGKSAMMKSCAGSDAGVGTSRLPGGARSHARCRRAEHESHRGGFHVSRAGRLRATGHFLIGDAAAFMDPIFSTGVSVAVNGAIAAVAAC